MDRWYVWVIFDRNGPIVLIPFTTLEGAEEALPGIKVQLGPLDSISAKLLWETHSGHTEESLLKGAEQRVLLELAKVDMSLN